MHKNCLQLELHQRPQWGAYATPPDHESLLFIPQCWINATARTNLNKAHTLDFWICCTAVITGSTITEKVDIKTTWLPTENNLIKKIQDMIIHVVRQNKERK